MHTHMPGISPHLVLTLFQDLALMSKDWDQDGWEGQKGEEASRDDDLSERWMTDT